MKRIRFWRLGLGIALLLTMVMAPSFGWADITLDGGATLTVPPDITNANETIGNLSAGTLNQTGGTNTVTNVLTLGNSATGSGFYTLSGGTLSVNSAAGSDLIGLAGRGAFTQTGGAHLVTNSLIVGGTDGLGNNGIGSYSLSGGTLSVGVFEELGNVGSGIFTQTAGSHTVAGDLDLGVAGGSGAYTLSGSGSLTAINEVVGYSGRGAFTQTGGTNTVTGTLYLGYNAGSNGTYNLSGGSLSAANEIIGGAGPGAFIHTGGTNSADTIIIGSNGTYSLSGAGVLMANNFTGNLTNGGTVNPGRSVGTLTVTGSYAQTASGTLAVEIASPTTYDKLVVTGAPGSATLNGTLRPELQAGYFPSINQVFPGVITATGGVTGTFAQIPQISPTLFWQALYHPNSVDLQTVANFTAPNLNLSPSQATVGNVLNSFTGATSGDIFTVLNAITALSTTQQVQSAFNEILPLKYASLPSLNFPVTRMQFQYLRNRMARLRGEAEFGSSAFSFGGGGFMKGYDTKMVLAASNFASDAGNPLIRRGKEKPWGVYLDPMVNWGNVDSTSGQVGYQYTNAGFTLGADYWLLENLLVGLNTGYNNTGAGLKETGGSINVNSIPFNAYSSFFSNGYYLNGIIGYTYEDFYNMERNVVFGTLNRTARASTTGNQFQLAAETGYDLKVGNAIINPLVSLYYTTLSTGAFTENNAGALNLRVPVQSATSVQTGLGARAGIKAKKGGVTFIPQVSAVWQHEYSDKTRGLDARLAQGSGTIAFQTREPGRDFAVLSADFSAEFSKTVTANLGYTAEVGRSHSYNMGVNAGLRIAF
ncbi:MAG: autotransporter domain-containing protein [Deltaproteobacteria bacterium]|nr:autotransporter domain-containing protein [Deltaproteobacteria bacterium]